MTTTTVPKLTEEERLKRHGGPSPVRIAIVVGALALVVGWPVYSFISERVTGGVHDRGSYKEVDVATLASFKLNMRSGTIDDVPARFRALDGQRVRVRGFVHSIVESDGVWTKAFLLASRYQSQWGPGSLDAQERVSVFVPDGRKISVEANKYYWVTGTMHVKVLRDERDGIYRVFAVDLDELEPCD